MDIGQKLKHRRIELNLTQQEVADQLNLSRQSLSKWENNKSLPDLETTILLSDIYDISLDLLLRNKVDLDYEKIRKRNKRKEKILMAKNIMKVSLSVITLSFIVLATHMYTKFYQINDHSVTLENIESIERSDTGAILINSAGKSIAFDNYNDLVTHALFKTKIHNPSFIYSVEIQKSELAQMFD